MANVYTPAPNGFNPVQLLGGRPYAGATRYIPIASGYAQNLGDGDLVTIASDGTVNRVDTSSGAKVAFAAPPVGIFLGCTYTDPNLKYKVFKQYWPTGTVAADAQAIVADDPDIIMQSALVNGSGVAYTTGGATLADLGQNVGYYQPSTPVNTATGNSAVAINYASHNTTSTLPFRIIEIVPESILSDGTYGAVQVIYNFGLHQYRQATGV